MSAESLPTPALDRIAPEIGRSGGSLAFSPRLGGGTRAHVRLPLKGMVA